MLMGLLVCAVWVGSIPAALAQPARFAPDELLVGFRGGVGRARAEATYRAQGATKVEELGPINVHRIRVPAQALAAIERALARRPEVKFVERNHAVRVQFIPGDALFPSQWHHFTINSPGAWDVAPGASSLVIAIIDTGVDSSHPDLVERLVPGYNPAAGTSDTRDVYGHGTKTAGTAAATGNNGIGVAGVAFAAGIMPVKGCGDDGYCYYSNVASGILWAADHGARVISMSIGGVAASATITSAAQYARSKGAVVVAAAGNCGCFDSTPENPYIVSVSATDGSDALASWSSTGNYVELAAPGVGIYTTTAGGGYEAPSGTSFAAPIVAGVAALVLGANPALGAADVEALLKSTAVDLGAAGWDPQYGYGRVDAYRAVAAAAAAGGSRDTTPPAVAITAPADGATLSGAVTVSVAASDSGGVARTELYVDGTLWGTDVAAPWEFFLDTTRLANGSHVLTARAVDSAGNVGTASPISVTVSNTTPTPALDTTPPTVSITSISQFRNRVRVSVSAADDTAVSKVELYVDGQLMATSTSPSPTFNLNANRLSPTSHTFTARAYDAAGNTGDATTSFTVSK
jgi:thermitase